MGLLFSTIPYFNMFPIHVCLGTMNGSVTLNINIYIYVCVTIVDDGWLKQHHLVSSDWTLGLGEAEHLLLIE